MIYFSFPFIYRRKKASKPSTDPRASVDNGQVCVCVCVCACVCVCVVHVCVRVASGMGERQEVRLLCV